MPIVDRVLLGEEESTKNEWPSKTRIGDFVERIIRRNLEEQGDCLWLTDVSTEKFMSYSQLLSSVESVAGSLWDKGLRPGDTVLIMASNHLELPITFLAAWKAGGSVTCLTLNLLKDTIAQRVRQTRPKFIVADELRIERVTEAVRGLDSVQEIFVIGKSDGFTSISDLISNNNTECPKNVEVDSDSTAWVMYSSGTTGIQKAIIHTHKSLSRFLQNTKIQRNRRGVKHMFVNLMINAGGMLNVLLFSILHVSIYCLSQVTCYDDVLAAIDHVKPFSVTLSANHIAWICRHTELSKYDVSSIVSLMTIGTTINPNYERQIFDMLPNLLLLNIYYGSIETGTICSNQPKPAELIGLDKSKAIERHIIGSCGKVLPDCKLKIIDKETGEKLGPGEEGEVCVQAPSMLKEYLDMPEETAHLIRDGWCHTGDKGYYDINGNVFIVGRYKELIKYRNMHVVPTNIEKQMMMHSAVEDVGVVGLPHEFDGELPLAFVVLRSGMSVTAQELIDFTNAKVVDEERLRGGIRFIDKIPRNDLGKIVRPELMKLLPKIIDN